MICSIRVLLVLYREPTVNRLMQITYFWMDFRKRNVLIVGHFCGLSITAIHVKWKPGDIVSGAADRHRKIQLRSISRCSIISYRNSDQRSRSCRWVKFMHFNCRFSFDSIYFHRRGHEIRDCMCEFASMPRLVGCHKVSRHNLFAEPSSLCCRHPSLPKLIGKVRISPFHGSHDLRFILV